MTKRIALLCVAVLAAAALVVGAGCSAEPGEAHSEEHHHAADEAIHRLQYSVTEYLSIDSDSDVGDIRSITERITTGWEALEANAAETEMDTGELASAHDDLVAAVDALTDDMPAEEAMAEVQPQVDAFAAAVEELHEQGHFHEE